MALIVEDGTGTYSATAESYISVTDADTYHTNRGNTLWATMTTTEKEQALRRSTDYMCNQYGRRWKGVKMQSTVNQLLDWPRAYVYSSPFLNGAVGESPYLVPDDIVPLMVKNACAELAFRAASGELAADIDRKTLEETVGPITVKYDPNSSQILSYRQIDTMLSDYLKSNGGMMVSLNRV